jgi:hypothetical protein
MLAGDHARGVLVDSTAEPVDVNLPRFTLLLTHDPAFPDDAVRCTTGNVVGEDRYRLVAGRRTAVCPVLTGLCRRGPPQNARKSNGNQATKRETKGFHASKNI